MATELIDQIVARAAASPEAEVCGLLLGSGKTVEEARACRNVAADPAHRFEIDPAALLAAHRAERGGGPAVLGCYHSHPSGSPEPSPRDAADAAANGWLWVVATCTGARLWQAVEDGGLYGRFRAVYRTA